MEIANLLRTTNICLEIPWHSPDNPAQINNSMFIKFLLLCFSLSDTSNDQEIINTEDSFIKSVKSLSDYPPAILRKIKKFYKVKLLIKEDEQEISIKAQKVLKAVTQQCIYAPEKNRMRPYPNGSIGSVLGFLFEPFYADHSLPFLFQEDGNIKTLQDDTKEIRPSKMRERLRKKLAIRQIPEIVNDTPKTISTSVIHPDYDEKLISIKKFWENPVEREIPNNEFDVMHFFRTIPPEADSQKIEKTIETDFFSIYLKPIHVLFSRDYVFFLKAETIEKFIRDFKKEPIHGSVRSINMEKIVNEVNRGTVCAICLDPFQRNDNKSGCTSAHNFHAACLQQWKNKSKTIGGTATCPLCRVKL